MSASLLVSAIYDRFAGYFYTCQNSSNTSITVNIFLTEAVRPWPCMFNVKLIAKFFLLKGKRKYATASMRASESIDLKASNETEAN